VLPWKKIEGERIFHFYIEGLIVDISEKVEGVN
jgi:hypothetical protein